MLKLLALLAISSASAQQQPSTALDRVSSSLGMCVGTLENIKDELVKVQQENAKLKDQIEVLKKDKPDAK